MNKPSPVKPANPDSVKHIIEKIPIEHKFMILPKTDEDSIRPIQYIDMMDRNQYILSKFIPELVTP